MLRPVVQFRSSFPDDAAYDADDVVQAPGGRNIAEALKVALEQSDYRVAGPLDAGDHGWALDIWSGRQRMSLQVTVIDADENYLVAEPCGFWPNRNLFQKLLADLKVILDADVRFKQVGWSPKGRAGDRTAPAAGPLDP